MICVFDSSALIAFIRRESGWDAVRALLADMANERLVHALNLTEVFYDERRVGGETMAQATLDALTSTGLQNARGPGCRPLAGRRPNKGRSRAGVPCGLHRPRPDAARGRRVPHHRQA